MKSKTKSLLLLASALSMSAGVSGVSFPKEINALLRPKEKRKAPTKSDLDRLKAAQDKRERRAAKRVVYRSK